MVERIIDLENHAWRHLFISHTRRFILPSIDYRTYILHIYIYICMYVYIYIDNAKGSDKYLSFFIKKIKEKDSSITRDRIYFFIFILWAI